MTGGTALDDQRGIGFLPPVAQHVVDRLTPPHDGPLIAVDEDLRRDGTPVVVGRHDGAVVAPRP